MSTSAATGNPKAVLREQVIARRDALPPDARQAAAQALTGRPFPAPLPAGVIVSGFMPMRSEISPLPLMRKLTEAGARLALPVVVGRGHPLTMRAYAFGDPLDAGQWGIREPQAGAAQVDPDIVLTPLAAFDRRGHRIGYGAGYYDRTLADLRRRKPVLAIGLAFALQEIDAVPETDHDVALDLVLTEREIIDCRGA